MSHYAHITNGIVDQVIVAEKKFIDSGAVGDPSQWIKTSYNTRGGVHFSPTTKKQDGGIPLRKNYAGVGYAYDQINDAFIPPKPTDGEYTLNESTCLWDPVI